MAAKRWKRGALSFAQRIGIFDLLQWPRLVGDQRLYVLMYHRVDEYTHRPWLDPEQISATPQQLEKQFRLIAAKYHSVSVEDVLAALDGQRSLPRRAVLVTVDDGYRDFGEVICPTAWRYGIRPVVFIPTAYVGQRSFWWDRLYQIVFFSAGEVLSTPLGEYSLRTEADKKLVLNHLRYRLKLLPFMEAIQIVDGLYAGVPVRREWEQPSTLNWEELRSLASSGATIAAHTHTHPLLSRIPFDQACEEIRTSQALILREIGKAMPVFAFPEGKPQFYTPELLDFLGEEGFKFILTTIEGSASLSDGRALCFPRLAVRPSFSLAAFHVRMTPLYRER